MKTLISSVILLTAACAPVYAQIYKWVDEAGKTHYSDQAPAVGKKSDTVADRISVYSPDPSFLARAAANAAPDPALSDRVDRLEGQLHAERLARQQVGVAHARRHDPYEDLVLHGLGQPQLLQPERLFGMAQHGGGDHAAHAASSAVRLAQP